MEKRNKIIIIAISVLIFLFIAFSIYWVIYLNIAHSTFENYYKFRGCKDLIYKTDDYGNCRLADGEIIKLVKYNDKWFLDGDLPGSGIF